TAAVVRPPVSAGGAAAEIFLRRSVWEQTCAKAFSGKQPARGGYAANIATVHRSKGHDSARAICNEPSAVALGGFLPSRNKPEEIPAGILQGSGNRMADTLGRTQRPPRPGSVRCGG